MEILAPPTCRNGRYGRQVVSVAAKECFKLCLRVADTAAPALHGMPVVAHHNFLHYHYLTVSLLGRQRCPPNGPLAPKPSGNAPNTLRSVVFSSDDVSHLMAVLALLRNVSTLYLHLTSAAGRVLRICSMHLGVLKGSTNLDDLGAFLGAPEALIDLMDLWQQQGANLKALMFEIRATLYDWMTMDGWFYLDSLGRFRAPVL